MHEFTYFVGPIISVVLLAVIISALLHGRLRERHALWWVIGAVLALVLSLFPSLLDTISASLGIVVPLNLVFILAIALMFFVSLQHAAELTKLEERVRALAEHVAALEMPQEPPSIPSDRLEESHG